MPFSDFVDLEDLKKTLLGLALDPSIGGLLILGPKGTGNSSLVRAFAELLPDIEVVVGCRFGCSPDRVEELCGDCSTRLKEDGKLPHVTRKMSTIEGQGRLRRFHSQGRASSHKRHVQTTNPV